MKSKSRPKKIAIPKFKGGTPPTLEQFYAKWLELLWPHMNDDDRAEFKSDLGFCVQAHTDAWYRQAQAMLGRDEIAPMPILLWCPECRQRHIDVGEFATKLHTTHACQHCGHVWRPAIAPTVGVQFLPGFKNAS